MNWERRNWPIIKGRLPGLLWSSPLPRPIHSSFCLEILSKGSIALSHKVFCRVTPMTPKRNSFIIQFLENIFEHHFQADFWWDPHEDQAGLEYVQLTSPLWLCRTNLCPRKPPKHPQSFWTKLCSTDEEANRTTWSKSALSQPLHVWHKK